MTESIQQKGVFQVGQPFLQLFLLTPKSRAVAFILIPSLTELITKIIKDSGVLNLAIGADRRNSSRSRRNRKFHVVRHSQLYKWCEPFCCLNYIQDN